MAYLKNKVTPCRKKVKFIRIDGSTPAQSRGELVNKFQQNSDVRVAILSINAAGTGLTLTVSPFFMLMQLENWSQTVTETPDTAVGTSSAMSPCSLLGTESF